jgi:hypothetical protein
MADPSTGAFLKLNWGQKRLHELEVSYRLFLNPKPYGVVFDPDPQTGGYFVKASISTPPLLDWSLLIGDCLHNFRSALDHFANQLASTQSASPKNDRTQFPIFKIESDFRRLQRSYIGRLSEEAQIEIEKLQPYNRADGPPILHPLWLLATLSNADKHRLLNLVYDTISDGSILIRGINGDAQGSIIQTIQIPRMQCPPLQWGR